jgi:hypothetical protein
MKYRKLPVEIEAIQWDGNNLVEVVTFLEGKSPKLDLEVTRLKGEDYEDLIAKEGLYIKTLEGNMKASINDYIIKGIAGEFYPCKEDIFLKTYESVN